MQENATRGYTLPSERARIFQVDLEPAVAVGHVTPELFVEADAGAMLAALLERLLGPGRLAGAAGGGTAGAAERARRNDADRKAFVEARQLPRPGSARPGNGVDHAHVVRTLASVLPPEGIIATDGGNFYGWIARHFCFRRPRTYVGPASGSMGYGLPGAIGAKIARPDLPVVSLSGDGGFLMTMAEIETAVRYGVGVVALVLDNERHGTIRMHQERAYPRRVVGTDLTTPDLAAVAGAFGARGFEVVDDAGFEPALRAALAADGPAVVHVRIDREQLSVDTRLSEGAIA
jgi:acetolactate synthase-1/2/3 large subunit